LHLYTSTACSVCVIFPQNIPQKKKNFEKESRSTERWEGKREGRRRRRNKTKHYVGLLIFLTFRSCSTVQSLAQPQLFTQRSATSRHISNSFEQSVGTKKVSSASLRTAAGDRQKPLRKRRILNALSSLFKALFLFEKKRRREKREEREAEE